MTKNPRKTRQTTPIHAINHPQNHQKTTLTNIVDTALFLFCCILVAGRCHIHESFPTTWRVVGPVVSVAIGQGQTTAMLTFAGLTCTAAFIWLATHLRSPQFHWRKTALIGPFALLTLASIISTLLASNKHTAIVAALTLLSNTLLAILLIQLLDSPTRQRLLLCAIAATGVAMAYRCWEQHHYEIPVVLNEHAKNPDAALLAQGIEPNTYAASQFLERLESRDVGGYFAISNSAAAFFILSIAATAALIAQGLTHRPRPPQQYLLTTLGTIALILQLIGLTLTHSKGGIGALITGTALLAVLWLARNWLSRHWRTAIITAVVIILAAITVVATYGIAHDRLPTASMWVRWQYWQSSAAMIADHWFTGVGPANFGNHYTQYMNPAAPEVVQDPHSFPIALWTQWGLLSIIALAWAALAIAIKLASPPLPTTQPSIENTKDSVAASGRRSVDGEHQKLAWLPHALLITLGIIAIRLATTDLTGTTSANERNSVYIMAFIIPAIIYLAAFAATWTSTASLPSTTPMEQPSNTPTLILAVAILAFLLHNCIDFAIFQPGINTCFFALVAAALAQRLQTNHQPHLSLTPSPRTRWTAAILSLAAVAALWTLIIIPATRCQSTLKKAQDYAVRTNQLRQAIAAAESASTFNTLDPDGPHLAARLYYRWWSQDPTNTALLERADHAMTQAAQRNPARFTYYKQLSDIYHQAAIQNPQLPQSQHYSDRALEYLTRALDLYPGKSELLIQYGRLLESANRPSDALSAYKKAITIDDDFLIQQRALWPDRPQLFTRLTPQQRKLAKDRIKALNPNQHSVPTNKPPM